MSGSIRNVVVATVLSLGITGHAVPLQASGSEGNGPIVVWLDADFSGPLSEISESIRIGAEIAAEEINRDGTLLGRPLEIAISDHRSNPRRALDNFEDAVSHGVVAWIAGAQSAGVFPVLPLASERGIPVISAFPAHTMLTRQNLDPNPVFRVSAQDGDVVAFLADRAIEAGYKRFAAIFENSGWGASNEQAFSVALGQRGDVELIHTDWFALDGDGFDQALDDALSRRPDALLVIGKSAQGALTLARVSSLPEEERPIVLLHQGTSIGPEIRRAAADAQGVKLAAFRTVNLEQPRNAESTAHFLRLACDLKRLCARGDFVNHLGLAQGYDAMHLLARAIAAVERGERTNLIEAMENLEPFEGLVRRYAPAFTAERREALTSDDFMLVRFDATGIPVPMQMQIQD